MQCTGCFGCAVSRSKSVRVLAGAADDAALGRLKDGPGQYSLVGFISHMGANTACGHYVAHIRKQGRWVIYNDEKACVTPSGASAAVQLSTISRCKERRWRSVATAGGKPRTSLADTAHYSSLYTDVKQCHPCTHYIAQVRYKAWLTLALFLGISGLEWAHLSGLCEDS